MMEWILKSAYEKYNYKDIQLFSLELDFILAKPSK